MIFSKILKFKSFLDVSVFGFLPIGKPNKIMIGRYRPY
jgi:hypothetical protein